MLKISIVCVGSIREKFYKDALNEYVKRLSPYCNLAIHEVADERLSEQAPFAEKEKVLPEALPQRRKQALRREVHPKNSRKKKDLYSKKN